MTKRKKRSVKTSPKKPTKKRVIRKPVKKSRKPVKKIVKRKPVKRTRKPVKKIVKKSKPKKHADRSNQKTRGQKTQKKIRDTKQRKSRTDKRHVRPVRRVKPQITVERQARKNLVRIKLPSRSFLKKVEAVNNWNGKELEYLIQKNKPDGKHFKPPQAVVVVFKVKKRGQPGYYYNSFTSPIDMVMNKENIKKFVAQSISDYNNNSLDIIAEIYDEPIVPYNVPEISIRFIY